MIIRDTRCAQGLVVAAVLVIAIVARPAAGEGQAQTTTWSGVYTEAQAARGQQAYGRSCGGCHRDDLRGGDEGEPPLNGPIFGRNWEGSTVAALYDLVATDMPKSNPGSLPLTTCIDIVAFLLQLNGMPAGPAELTTDIDALDRIVFTTAPPAL